MAYRADIYNITNFVNNIQKKHTKEVSDETLQMSIYGHINDMFSSQIQNSIITASEWGNEAFPIRSKFEKTILTNAVTYNVNNINATPAKMTVMLGFIKRDLDRNMTQNIFRLDKNCKIMVGEYEYHLDYDLIIAKDRLSDNIYSARYDITRKNPVSDILNPYLLQPPIILNMSRDKFVFVTCVIRQVEPKKIYKKVISNNILENKSFDFDFDSQLAAFDVLVKEGNKDIYLKPIFEGMPLNGGEKYCFYNYIDKNTIRVKFDIDSYQPRMNCDVEINVLNTKGSECNFNYKDDIITTLKSDKINYKGMSMLIKPVSSSTNGINRKSIKHLKEIIPKEILSRGNIINNKDLENFFNDLDDNNKLKFKRKRDNQFERLYYSYMIVKDEDENVIPTNTINLRLEESDFDKFEDGRYVLNPGNIIKYDNGNYAYINNDIKEEDIYEEEQNNFLYSSPYTLIVNKKPLTVSYYLNQINRDYMFKFSYINNTSMQFISTKLHCYRNFIDSKNYKLTASIVQTMNTDKHLIDCDRDGKITKSNILPILVINMGDYNYYIKGSITGYDMSLFQYDVQFDLESDNIINKENKIKLKNICIGGSKSISDIYCKNNVNMSMYILAKYDDKDIVSNIEPIKEIVPDIEEGYTLCNKFDTIEPVDLFYNYSHVIMSKVKVNKNSENGQYVFNLQSVPVIRYSYITNVEKCNNVTDYIQFRKAYIDTALNVIENSFSVDLKFYNTYGMSKTFRIGYEGDMLDKVNLTLNFKVKLYVGSDKRIKDYIIHEIKSYIENINNSSINSTHMSNLTTYISNKFEKDIKFIEFTGLNKYDSTYQYLEKKETEIIEQVPEFLNINLSNDFKADINITLV